MRYRGVSRVGRLSRMSGMSRTGGPRSLTQTGSSIIAPLGGPQGAVSGIVTASRGRGRSRGTRRG